MTDQQQIRQINSIQNHFVREFGRYMIRLNHPARIMICLEGIVSGIVIVVGEVYGLDTTKLIADLSQGVVERVAKAEEIIDDPSGEP